MSDRMSHEDEWVAPPLSDIMDRELNAETTQRVGFDTHGYTVVVIETREGAKR